MKQILSIALLLSSTAAMSMDVYSLEFQTPASIELVEVSENDNVEKVIATQDLMTSVGSSVLNLDSETPVTIPLTAPTGPRRSGNSNSSRNETDGSKIIKTTRDLIALGKDIYSIVEAGKPVSNVSADPIEVLPKDDKDVAFSALDLHSWSRPAFKDYKIVVKNLFGFSVITLDLKVLATTGGQLDGNGRYLTGVQIYPTYVDVAWGWTLDVNFKLQSISNIGTATEPVATAVLLLESTVSTTITKRTTTNTYYVTGEGEITAY